VLARDRSLRAKFRRRQHVLGLRRSRSFPAGILITHIEQVRDGLDASFAFPTTPHRASIVRDDTATLGPPDASVAA